MHKKVVSLPSLFFKEFSTKNKGVVLGSSVALDENLMNQPIIIQGGNFVFKGVALNQTPLNLKGDVLVTLKALLGSDQEQYYTYSGTVGVSPEKKGKHSELNFLEGVCVYTHYNEGLSGWLQVKNRYSSGIIIGEPESNLSSSPPFPRDYFEVPNQGSHENSPNLQLNLDGIARALSAPVHRLLHRVIPPHKEAVSAS
jgi:hypothetical protein